MANIIPFKGYRYNAEKIENLGEVMSPPYDSISEEEKDHFYKMSPYNSVRLVLGKNFSDDTAENNCYTRANEYMQEWIENDILVQDHDAAVYMYEQSIDVNGTQYATKGIIGLTELESFSSDSIMPCEETISSSKQDRFNLLSATGANISMINCMYVNYDKHLGNMMNELAEEKPDVEFTTPSGIRQRIWVITYQPTIEYIIDNIKDKCLYITDGQNRYETALEYKNMMEKNNPNHTGKEEYNYIMSLYTNANDDGLVQLPVHRLVSFPKGFKEDFFIACAQDHFKIEKIIVDTNLDELVDTMKKQIATPRKENKFALYCGGNYFYRITLKDTACLESLIPDKSDAYRRLDVTVLNKLLLGELLNIDEEHYHERVTFTKRTLEGVKMVKDGEFGCMFIINPTKPSQIRDVATAGEKMPERSISLFPKPSTGVVFHKFNKNSK